MRAMTTRRRHRLTPAALLCAAVIPLAACATERRVISVRGGLSGIQGAQGGELAQAERTDRPTGSAYAELAARQRQQAAVGETETDPRALRITRDDGTITLISTSPRHVVLHLRQTLTQDEPDLLFDQVLSDRAKDAYRKNGLDPHDAVGFLIEHRRDVLMLLQRMPQGEFTPGMFLEKIGPGAYRLQLNGASGQGLSFQRLDIVWEHGVCRLLSIS